MNFREQTLKEHTKSNAFYIVEHLMSHPKEMGTFIQVFLHGEYRVTQRLAWSLSFLAKKIPDYIKPYLPVLIKHIRDKTKHAAVRRNILRAMEEMDIPNQLQGEAYAQCLDALMDGQEPIAVRCFAMKIAGDIALQHPDLAHEVIEAIKLNEEGASAGYKARSRKILAQLSKL